jgi:hypothetical protein
MYACMHACMHRHVRYQEMRAYMYACMHRHIQAPKMRSEHLESTLQCKYIYVCICICVYIDIYMCVCMCIYIYIYIYIYKHTHTYIQCACARTCAHKQKSIHMAGGAHAKRKSFRTKRISFRAKRPSEISTTSSTPHMCIRTQICICIKTNTHGRRSPCKKKFHRALQARLREIGIHVVK